MSGAKIYTSVLEVLYEEKSAITGVSPSLIPDDGGVELTLTGNFSLSTAYTVYLGDGADLSRPCFPGVIGGGVSATPTTSTTMKCWAPPMPPGTGYDITAIPLVGPTVVGSGLIDVERRTHTSTSYGLRSAAARPRYVGAYSIEDED